MGNKRGLILNRSNQIEPGILGLADMHNSGISHVHSCLLLTRTGIKAGVDEVLLQQRGMDKAQYPGHWCFSAAGHCNENDFIRALELGNEADLEGLARETQEELGIKIDLGGNNGKWPTVSDAEGSCSQVGKRSIHRLFPGPFTPVEDGIQPFNELPILTVGHFHVLNRVSIEPRSSEIESIQWVPINKLMDLKMTPWLEYYLKFAPNVTNNQAGRQYNYGQIECGAQVAQSTVGAVY